MYYKSQKAYSNEMLPLNNYDLKFMEKVEGAVGRTFVLKITSNFQGEKEEKNSELKHPILQESGSERLTDELSIIMIL